MFFQSHFGLILSIPFFNHSIRSCFAFNPILVWFYRCSYYIRIALSSFLSIPFWSDFIISIIRKFLSALTNFQSHFGLILSAWRRDFAVCTGWAFNPILVWFYPGSFRHTATGWHDFQSHFGLILSVVISVKITPSNFLSIPFWSDFIFSEYSSFFTSTRRFQSHFGLILSQSFLNQPRRRRSLSIPFWSDFI